MPVSPRLLEFRVLLKQWLVIAAGVCLASFLSKGIQFDSAPSLILAVLFISALNVFLKPLLLFMGLPFIVMTFGVGILLINAFIFYLAGWLVPGFTVVGFWPAFWGAFVVSMTTVFVNLLLARPKVTVTRQVPRVPKAKGGAKQYRGKLDDVIDV